MSTKPKIIVVLGPNASGKSALAVEVARKYNGEVISADSRQVYRGMDLGTGKITKKEMAGVPHYLLDVASPRQRFTVAQYKKLALAAIKKIRRQNKLPIICGGTGFYIQAVADNISIPEVKAVRNNNVLTLNGRFQSRLIPRFNDEEMKDKISGKNTKETRAIIKTIPEVSDVQINFSPNLPFVDTIPRDKSKITFKVEAS